ncbi:hypothetical protein D021_0060B, partial [Vibrio parahaemolyticus 10296]
LTHKGSI